MQHPINNAAVRKILEEGTPVPVKNLLSYKNLIKILTHLLGGNMFYCDENSNKLPFLKTPLENIGFRFIGLIENEPITVTEIFFSYKNIRYAVHMPYTAGTLFTVHTKFFHTDGSRYGASIGGKFGEDWKWQVSPMLESGAFCIPMFRDATEIPVNLVSR